MTTHLSVDSIAASEQIMGFKELLIRMQDAVRIEELSQSTYFNYSRKLAQIVLFYKRMPDEILEEEVNDYLVLMVNNARSYSRSEFKHLVYSLRFYFKIIGRPNAIKLPKIKIDKRLPVILNRTECKMLFDATDYLKHRLILRLMYASGLRVSELINLKWSNVDLGRMLIHIQRAKGNKDRYVPLAESLLPDLLTYIEQSIVGEHVFPGALGYAKMSCNGIRFAMKQSLKRAGIQKHGVCLHTLRHSYATHLLEYGIDIVSIKELLGHSRIDSTLVYLHVANTDVRKKISPLDKLYKKISQSEIDLIKVKFAEKSLQILRNSTQNPNQMRLFE